MKNITIFIVGLMIGSGLVLVWGGLEKKQLASVTVIHDSLPFFVTDTVHHYHSQTIVIPADKDTIWLTENSDSLAFDWAMERWYIDTLMNDTNALIVVSSVVNQNALQEQNLEYLNRRPLTIIQQIPAYRPKGLWIGGYAGKQSGGVMAGYQFNKILVAGSAGSDGVKINFLYKIIKN